VLADFDVMSDLDQVVQLRSTPNNGCLERAAVDARVRANFHVILDYDSSNLRKFDMSGTILDEPKSVRADDGACVNNYAATNVDISIDHNAREKTAIVAYI
jgi:hypothetical protein